MPENNEEKLNKKPPHSSVPKPNDKRLQCVHFGICNPTHTKLCFKEMYVLEKQF